MTVFGHIPFQKLFPNPLFFEKSLIVICNIIWYFHCKHNRNCLPSAENLPADQHFGVGFQLFTGKSFLNVKNVITDFFKAGDKVEENNSCL